MKGTKSQSNEKDVIIKGTATVNGGITCGECVENKHSECSIADCLCAKKSYCYLNDDCLAPLTQI